MREIKFMIWHKTYKTICPVDDINFGGNQIFFELSEATDLYEANFNEVELLQFTGLKDANGKEIYEGDIIKTPNGHIVEVFFGTHTFKHLKHTVYGKIEIEITGWLIKNHKLGSIGELDYSICAGEIIGNIYEHPELLK